MAKIAYTLFRSNRKTVQIKVKDGKVIVHAPLSCPKSKIDEFVSGDAEKIKSIMKWQKEYKASLEKQSSEGKLLFRGKEIVLPGANVYTVRRFLDDAKWELVARTKELAAAHGLKYGKLSFSDARTLWGTCSSSHDIRLNIRLLCLDPRLWDYVILHELTHTLHHDHSPAFWADLEKMMPDCQRRRAELKEFGYVLECYR